MQLAVKYQTIIYNKSSHYVELLFEIDYLITCTTASSQAVLFSECCLLIENTESCKQFIYSSHLPFIFIQINVIKRAFEFNKFIRREF